MPSRAHLPGRAAPRVARTRLNQPGWDNRGVGARLRRHGEVDIAMALYRYATMGEASGAFALEDLNGTFRPRGGLFSRNYN